jgi:hypothetical protein
VCYPHRPLWLFNKNSLLSSVCDKILVQPAKLANCAFQIQARLDVDRQRSLLCFENAPLGFHDHNNLLMSRQQSCCNPNSFITAFSITLFTSKLGFESLLTRHFSTNKEETNLSWNPSEIIGFEPEVVWVSTVPIPERVRNQTARNFHTT